MALVNKTTNWDAVRTQLDNLINLSQRYNTAEDLDQATTLFTDMLQQAISDNTQYRNSLPPEVEYPCYIWNLVLQRRRARKTWQQHQTAEARSSFNNLSRRTTRAIRQWKNDTFESYT